MDWQTIAALGAFLVAGISILSRTFDKSLSLREHEEFKANVQRMFDTERESVHREIELVRNYERELRIQGTDRIKVLEQTRPTTETLQAELRGKPL